MTTTTARAISLKLGEDVPLPAPWPRGFDSITFDVRGKAKTQGDLVRSPHGGLYHRDRDELINWRLRIANAAEAAMGELVPTTQAVLVELEFLVYRPATHYLPINSRRQVIELRADAPAHPTTRRDGDIDKLIRAALDALTSVAYVDDSQVVDVHVKKRFAGLDEARGVHGLVRALQDVPR